jgi:hypothetical protein
LLGSARPPSIRVELPNFPSPGRTILSESHFISPDFSNWNAVSAGDDGISKKPAAGHVLLNKAGHHWGESDCKRQILLTESCRSGSSLFSVYR